MIELFIIADDITGAIDTGIQFVKNGAVTQVVTNLDLNMDPEVQVLVWDAETRHLPPERAKTIVESAVKKALVVGVRRIYKKTDSALRGNIGAELEAVCEATEDFLHFFPAFPQLNRITLQGIQYIMGVPVAQSVFGKDPFEPVTSSSIPEIIRKEASVPVKLMGMDLYRGNQQRPAILIYDSETPEQMEQLAQGLMERDELHCCAGCAGLASVLPKLLGFQGKEPNIPALPTPLLACCGSLNPITLRQLDQAEKSGMLRVHLSEESKRNPKWHERPEARKQLQQWKAQCLAQGALFLDSNNASGTAVPEEQGRDLEKTRKQIAWNLGGIVRELVNLGLEATLLLTGGDTLLGFLEQTGVTRLTPVCEVMPGVVLSRFQYGGTRYVISKSGGFGDVCLMENVRRFVLDSRINQRDSGHLDEPAV